MSRGKSCSVLSSASEGANELTYSNLMPPKENQQKLQCYIS